MVSAAITPAGPLPMMTCCMGQLLHYVE